MNEEINVEQIKKISTIKTLSITALVLAITGVIGTYIPMVTYVLRYAPIIAIILSIVSSNMIKGLGIDNDEINKSKLFNKIALITSIVFYILYLILIIIVVLMGVAMFANM